MPKIKQIHLYQHELPVKNGPYTMANAKVYSLKTLLVKIIADNGIVGWGETCPVGPTYAPSHAAGALSAAQEIAPALIGTEILPIPLHRKMNQSLNGHNYVKAAFDIAIHDCLGKILKISVADLLGGALTQKIPSYYASGIGTPDEIAKIAKQKLAEGYPRMQIKIGGRPIEIEIEVIRKVWEIIGTKMRLAIDGNRGLTTRDTIRLSRECTGIPFILEQPCDTIEEMIAIRPLLHHPLYIDESATDLSTVLRLVGLGICDGFGMKLTRIGGLHPMRAFRDICHARHLHHTCDDSWGGDIIAAACTHIAATTDPKILEAVWLAQPYIEGHYDDENPVKIIGGHINLPQGHGLGVNPDEAKLGAPIASF